MKANNRDRPPPGGKATHGKVTHGGEHLAHLNASYTTIYPLVAIPQPFIA